MTLQKKIWDMLRADGKLRMKVAFALGVGEVAVFQAVKRGSDTLTKIAAIKAIEEYTGLKEDEIIENVPA